MKKYIVSIAFISSIIFPAISLADYNGVGSISPSDIPNPGNQDYVYRYSISAGGNGVYQPSISSSGLTNGDQYAYIWGSSCSISSLSGCEGSTGNTPIYVYVYNGLFYTTIPAPAPTGSSLFPTATGNVPTLTGDSFSATEEIVAGIFGVFIIVLGLQLTFYFINSLVDLMTLRKGGKVKKISRLTAFMDRNSSAARGTRRRWTDDV